MFPRLTAAALSALVLSSTVSGIVTQCPSNAQGVCYNVGVPKSSASSNSGNIYFQITAPTSFSWVALGTGTRMGSSSIFLMYQDGKGNVTISPRAGANHVMPQVDTSSTGAKLTLLAGSGVSGNTMTANVMCSNCQTYSEGTMSLSGTSTPWIGAWKSGASISSTSTSAVISQHDDTDQWNFNLAQATIDTDSNPFVGSNASNTTTTTGGSGGSSGVDNGSSSSGGASNTLTLIHAHGVIMSIVMVILYPLGSALMPIFGHWMIHGAWQTVAYLLMWAGFAIGIMISQQTYINFTVTHTQLGVSVVALMGIQPILGYLHHLQYVRSQSRGAMSWIHVYYGRALMILGVINGGLGLQLAGATNMYIIPYAVVAGIVFLIYVGAKTYSATAGRGQGSLRTTSKEAKAQRAEQSEVRRSSDHTAVAESA